MSTVALTLVFGCFSVAETNAQTLNEILNTMQKHKKTLQSLSANIKMSEYESVLKEERVKNGSVRYVPKPGKDAWVRVDWVSPDETLVVANGKYILYRKRLNQAITGKTDGSKAAKGTSNSLKFMSMSKRELEDNYTVQYLGQPVLAGTAVWHLKLTPKGSDSFKEAELWVDGNGMPIQAMMREKNNDETTIRLSSLKKNEEINASIFKLDLKGITIVSG
jgi:outer membrane lipoprotein-sorting protein